MIVFEGWVVDIELKWGHEYSRTRQQKKRSVQNGGDDAAAVTRRRHPSKHKLPPVSETKIDKNTAIKISTNKQ